MADTDTAQSPTASAKPEVTSSTPAEGDAPAAAATEPSAAGADPTATEDSAAPAESSKPADATAEDATDADDKQDTTDTNGDKDEAADAAEAADGQASTNGTSAAGKKKDNKRRSSGVPEHKNKKLNKKKSMPTLNLNAQPGEMFYARMKGHPPWPAIVCDQDMLPESLLSRRPVSAAYPDGTYRPDFQEGGKNAKERRYPIMFLGTNEFAWHVNTELQPLDVDEIKQIVENDDQGKKTRSLWEAYKVAAEDHDLVYFKTMLDDHEKQQREHLEAIEQKEAEAQAKKEKKEKAAKRKSKGAADAEDDVEMEDAADEKAAEKKPSKKRKKAAESEGEAEKPAKTPKTKLKVKGPKETPDESASKPKKTTKPKKVVAKAKAESEEEEEASGEVELTDEQKRERREKNVLYIRHKLQKGFISRDHPPKEEEMKAMSEHLSALEAHTNLELQVIKATKINKVLKAILKIDIIPKDSEFSFKDRCNALLADYNRTLGADTTTTPTTAAPAVNGVKHDEEDKPVEAEKSDAPKVPLEATNGDDADVSMADPKDEPEKAEETTEKAADEGAVAA